MYRVVGTALLDLEVLFLVMHFRNVDERFTRNIKFCVIVSKIMKK